MPDPLLFGEAFAAAAIVSLCCGLLLRRGTGRWAVYVAPVAGLLAVAAGIIVGLAVLGVSLRVPPRNGLDRFLLVLLPAALIVELVSAHRRVPRHVAVCLRFVVAAASGWILLHDSTYLHADSDEWTRGEMCVALALCAGGLFAAWQFATWLDETRCVPAAHYSLSLAIFCAGLLVMLGGYLKGGAAAFPIAAALIGGTLSCGRSASQESQRRTLGLGVVSLFGLLFIGRYFGGLSSLTSIIVFVAPLAGWLFESVTRSVTTAWHRILFHLLIVAVPLAILLGQAKSDFDRKFGPLLRGQPAAAPNVK